MEKQVQIAAEQVYAGWNEDFDYNSLWHHSIGKPRTGVSDKHEKLNFNYGIVVGCLTTSLLIEEHEVSTSISPLQCGVRFLGGKPRGIIAEIPNGKSRKQ